MVLKMIHLFFNIIDVINLKLRIRQRFLNIQGLIPQTFEISLFFKLIYFSPETTNPESGAGRTSDRYH